MTCTLATYVIAWRSRLTGLTGRGEPIDITVANAHVIDLNAKYTNIEHWVEKLESNV